MAIKLGGNTNRVIVNQKASSQIILENKADKIDLTDAADATINLSGSTGKVDLTNGSSKIPIYSGEYEVIPKVEEEQTLETSGYAMAQDVLVKEIPFYEVKNTAGGLTATIG